MSLHISNRDARRLWLHALGLGTPPTGPLDVMAIFEKLGFVQLDTIQNVVRAHHHILWSRNQHYREPLLDKVMSRDRMLFEHFTHDASVIPMAYYPMWKKQFRRMRDKMAKPGGVWYASPDSALLDHVRDRIAAEGPLHTGDFENERTGKRDMWARDPHKRALDHLWYTGELGTCHRNKFRKIYDLAERIVPAHLYEQEPTEAEQVNWLCRTALERLGFATLSEIRRFWDALSVKEVRDWAAHEAPLAVCVEGADGRLTTGIAAPDIENRLKVTPAPTSRLRLLNPFDPAIRDRKRLKHLFGFDYRNEIFVPAAERQWGYYVYPLLEGHRLVGRIELKADRKAGHGAGHLRVVNFWTEPGVKWTIARDNKLNSELKRFARFAGLETVIRGTNRVSD